MSTTPVTPAPLPTPVQTELSTVVASLQKHTFTMNLLNLGIILAVLGTLGFMYMHTMQAFQAQLAKADAKDQVYEKTLNDLQTQWKTDQQAIATLQAQKDQIHTQVIYRDKTTDTAIATVTAPTRTQSQVTEDVQTSYQFPPVKLDGDNFEFTQPQVSTFVATKLDRDRLSLDLADTNKQLVLEAQANAKLSGDLAPCQSELKQANDVIAGYKKIAKPSKLKAFFNTVEKVGLFIGGAYIGAKIL